MRKFHESLPHREDVSHTKKKKPLITFHNKKLDNLYTGKTFFFYVENVHELSSIQIRPLKGLICNGDSL